MSPLTMSRESYTPKATMAAEIQGLQIGLGTVDDQCPMDEGQQEENGCQEHMKMAFTLSRVPQCEKVLLVSLGRMQIFLTAFHRCNALPPTGHHTLDPQGHHSLDTKGHHTLDTLGHHTLDPQGHHPQEHHTLYPQGHHPVPSRTP
eukprot:Em0002g98a